MAQAAIRSDAGAGLSHENSQLTGAKPVADLNSVARRGVSTKAIVKTAWDNGEIGGGLDAARDNAGRRVLMAGLCEISSNDLVRG